MMALTLQNLLDLEIGLTEFTDCRFFERLRLDDRSKTHLAMLLTLTMPLGLKLWYSEKTMELFMSSGDVLVSDGISLNLAGALSSVVVTLEFMREYLIMLKEGGALDINNRVAELEKRVAMLESVNNDGSDATTETVAKSDAKTSPEEIEYNYYLNLFRKRKPEFEEQGVDLDIDTETRQVRYQNGNLRPRCYDISQLGYKRASDALYNLKRRRSRNN